MQDEHQHLAEIGPMWRRIDRVPPPKNCKMLFRSLYGGVTVGVWYPESGWAFWSPLPKHTDEDKAWIREQSSSTAGRYSDGKPYEAT
jgi:hypothetical protein